jgi:WD40 repeat protein
MTYLVGGPAALGKKLGRHVRRFALLTIGFLILIGLLGVAETIVIRYRWPQRASSLQPPWISIGEFAIGSNGNWGVSRIAFGGGKVEVPASDLLLYDARKKDAVILEISHHRPLFIAVSPTSDDLAITCGDGAIRVWHGLTCDTSEIGVVEQEMRLFAQAPCMFSHIAFSPDGRLLAVLGSRFVSVWQWPSGQLLRKQPLDNSTNQYLSFSNSSRYVLSPGASGDLSVWNARSGKVTVSILPRDEFHIHNAILSPDEAFVAIYSFGSEVRVYRLADGEELWRAKHPEFSGRAFAYSPDGRLLAVTGSKHGVGRILLMDALDGRVKYRLHGHDATISTLTFKSGNLLYSGDIWGHIRCWNIEQQCEQSHFSTLEWGISNSLFDTRRD